ncbi:MAG: hypothetical protein DIU78_011810 [Pseudomonadota bacterium]|nr:MAG: hypothetical protein DIU78_07205 [Pseudomonadota bacterium]
MKRLALLGLLSLTGCSATLPKPPALAEAEQVRESPAVRTAAERAPQALAHAEALLERAQEAHESGDVESAQILAEHAVAAFEHAVILTRLAAAEARQGAAEARLAQAERELFTLEQQQRRELAEAEALELRARVLRDTLPLPTNRPASRDRELARLDAARALALEARLLCASAELLSANRPGVVAALRELDTLDGELARRPLPAPIDAAMRLRSRCLAELSDVRRPRTAQNSAGGAADALLEKLSRAELSPVRDDRGVVVTLRRAFTDADALEAKTAEQLRALAQVAQAHPEFPVLLVLHTAQGTGGVRERRRLDAAANALRQGGAPKVETALGGDASPVIAPDAPGAAERNARLEVVFIAPTTG